MDENFVGGGQAAEVAFLRAYEEFGVGQKVHGHLGVPKPRQRRSLQDNVFRAQMAYSRPVAG